MLLRFTVENYQCFRDRVTLDLVPTADKRHLGNVLESTGNASLKVVSLYGSNASGKTTILRAFQYLQGLIIYSASEREVKGFTQLPFVFDPVSKGRPTSFEVEFVQDSMRYQYGLSFDSRSVISEYLYAFPKKKRKIVFERDGQNFRFIDDRFIRKKIADNTSKSDLFVSSAAQLNDGECSAAYEWFAKMIPLVDYDVGRSLRTLVRKMESDPEFKAYILKASKIADFGITNIRDINIGVAEDSGQLVLDHIPDYRVEHTTDAFIGELPIGMESRGTLRFLSVIGPVISTLMEGGLIVIDEIDMSFHTDLCSWIVGLFLDGNENRNGAQLIFNTHDMELLDQDRMRRDQIWFTIKDPVSNASKLVRLSDFRIRNDLNIRKAYANGSFGGKPFIAPDTLME